MCQLARYDRTSVCKQRRLQTWHEEAASSLLTLSTASEGNDDSSTVDIGACSQEIHPLPSPHESDRSHSEQTAEQPTSLMTNVTMETISRLESE